MLEKFNDPMVGYALGIAFSLGVLIGGIFYSKYRWEKNIRQNNEKDRDGIF